MSEGLTALLEMLSSRSSIDRLRAARALAEFELDGLARTRIRTVASREVDSWVRDALSRLASSSDPPSLTETATATEAKGEHSTDSQTLADVRAQAIAAVTHTLLHEIRPLVGYVDGAAAREVPQFETSRTNKHIERLRRFLDTVSRLGDASRPPQPAEFDLTAAIATSLREMECIDIVGIARTDPVTSYGDWALIDLAFANAVRNAKEAAGGEVGDVVVNWGVTDRDSWLVVLDEGVGLPEGADIFEAGFTTKSRNTNQGWGLAIAQQAMQSAGGSIELRPRARGAVCEIRWPQRMVTV